MTKRFETVTTANVEWRDGQPYATLFSDVYYSVHDGLAESQHVFVEGNHLIQRWKTLKRDSSVGFTIAETGFGTGLNFLLAYRLWLEHAPQNARLIFFSCEKHPLKKEDLERALLRWPQLASLAQKLLDQWPIMVHGWHHLEFEQGKISLILIINDAQKALTSMLQSGTVDEAFTLPIPKVDAWFLDGFSPSKNPDMWSLSLFHTMALLSSKNTSIATYSVAQKVRSALEAVGFRVCKKPGFMHKHEMLSAVFTGTVAITHKTYKPCTAWQFSYNHKPVSPKAVIVGGGLAGSFLAYFLAQRNWKVTVIDTCASPGQGGSGNPQAVTFPHVSAFDSPLSRFMLQAWQFAINFYADFSWGSVPHEFKGLINIDATLCRDLAFMDFLSQHPSLGLAMDARHLSAIAECTINSNGIFFPQGGWIDARQLCQRLLSNPNISWQGGQAVAELSYVDEQWHVNKETAQTVILANGHQLLNFNEAATLPLKGIRGQMSYLAASASRTVAVPVCGAGHILPPRNTTIAIGASYDLQHQEAFCTEYDDNTNIKTLSDMPIDLGELGRAVHHWSGVRAVTNDYLPIAGHLVSRKAFVEQYQSLQKNARLSLAVADVGYPGLYALAGFGSRGLISIPYCARWLAGIINNEASIFPREMQQALSPARFLVKKIRRGFVSN